MKNDYLQRKFLPLEDSLISKCGYAWEKSLCLLFQVEVSGSWKKVVLKKYCIYIQLIGVKVFFYFKYFILVRDILIFSFLSLKFRMYFSYWKFTYKKYYNVKLITAELVRHIE